MAPKPVGHPDSKQLAGRPDSVHYPRRNTVPADTYYPCTPHCGVERPLRPHRACPRDKATLMSKRPCQARLPISLSFIIIGGRHCPLTQRSDKQSLSHDTRRCIGLHHCSKAGKAVAVETTGLARRVNPPALQRRTPIDVHSCVMFIVSSSQAALRQTNKDTIQRRSRSRIGFFTRRRKALPRH